MIPTPRLLALLLLGALVSAAGGVATLLALTILAAVVGAALADWLLARDLARVTVQRDGADKLSLGEWNPIHLLVSSAAARPLPITVRDVLPAGMDVDPPLTAFLSTTLAPGAETILTYRLRPTHRGDYPFGDLHVRAAGPLGLVVRQRRLVATSQVCRVFPSLRQLRRYDLLIRRGALVEAGARPLRVPGAGTEFERLREYLPDDEFRRINWKATARRGVPIVNQYETERSQNLVILLDTGRLMSAPALTGGVGGTLHSSFSTLHSDALLTSDVAPGLTKLDHAINTALLLAYVASQRDDRLALLAYADRVRAFLPPARGRRGVLRVLHALYNLDAEPVEPDHGLAFHYLAAHNLRRSLVVLFTDLADRESSAALAAHLQYAARSHQAVCVTLRDPAVDAPARRIPETVDELYAQMVAQRLLDERAQVLATLRHHGVLTVDTEASALSPQVINTYLELKHRGRM